MMNDETNIMWNQEGPIIDCETIINHVKNAAHQDMTIMNEKLEAQQSQINDLVKSLNKLVDSLTQARQNVPEGTKPPEKSRQNVPEGTQPPEKSRQNVPDGTEPTIPNNDNESRKRFAEETHTLQRTITDDGMSLQASNLWFGDKHQSTDVDDEEGDKKSLSNSGETLQQEQSYWQDSLNEYENDSKATGKEISSSIASAAKIYWHKPLKEEVFKKKMEEAKIPSNCPFLIPKRTNTEIWTTLSSYTRSTDVKIQEILVQHSAAVAMILRAASELTELNIKENKKPMLALKEALSLSGKVSQSANHLRRELMKPALPKGYAKLASEAEESSESLFGESICERLEKLKKENKLKEILTNERKPKRKYDSSNENPSSKSLRRVEYRHNHQRSRDFSSNSHHKNKYQFHQKKVQITKPRFPKRDNQN